MAGTEHAVLMVESEAQELSEEVMLGSVVFGHREMQAAINAINELADEAGKAAWDWQAPAKGESLVARISELCENDLREAFRLKQKQARNTRLEEIRKRVLETVAAGDPPPDTNLIKDIIFNLESKIVRSQILDGEPRIDGRDTRTVRPITARVGVLPRTHGSALFTRGETQALVVATLGTGRDEQIIDALKGEYKERFMLHYNMPPYATGETGRIGTAEAARGRPRAPRQAGAGVDAAAARGVLLLDPRRLRGHRVERLVLDGERLRRQPRADGRGRARSRPTSPASRWASSRTATGSRC